MRSDGACEQSAMPSQRLRCPCGCILPSTGRRLICYAFETLHSIKGLPQLRALQCQRQVHAPHPAYRSAQVRRDRKQMQQTRRNRATVPCLSIKYLVQCQALSLTTSHEIHLCRLVIATASSSQKHIVPAMRTWNGLTSTQLQLLMRPAIVRWRGRRNRVCDRAPGRTASS